MFGPSPQGFEDLEARFAKGLLADHVPVIVGPSPKKGIEPNYQLSGTHCPTGLDDFSDSIQEGLNILAGWFNEQFAVVFANVLPQKVKAFINVGNAGLFRREFEPSFFQKSFDLQPDILNQFQ